MCVFLCNWVTVCCMRVSSPCLKCTHLCGLFTQAVIPSSAGICVAHGMSFLPGVCFSYFPSGMHRRSQPWRHRVLLWIESAPPLFFWQCFLPPVQNMNESCCSALIACATRVLINELLPCVCSLQGVAGLWDGSESVWKSRPALLQFSQ